MMGRGIALQFKNMYPDNFKAYEAACQQKIVQPGSMFVYETGQLTPPRFIVNFPTKRHWRGKSRIEDIEAGLVDLVNVIRSKGIRSIAIPPLGAGLGGLDWNEVRSRIERALAELEDVRVLVYEPNGAPSSDKMAHVLEVPRMTAGRAALIELMQHYLDGLLDPFVTLLEVHKLMYFMQEAGESLQLKYVKAPYGPYAENLRHVLHAIEGHLISGYADGGDAPDKPLTLVPGAVEEAKNFLDRHEISRARIERVTRLVEGFESPRGLELLGTVHWVMSKEGAKSHDSVAHRVFGWSARKQRLSLRQLAIAERRLKAQGWLPSETMPDAGIEG
jgi:O-acetyl-ADP-ribose deacetylase (regulator of RNase III)